MEENKKVANSRVKYHKPAVLLSSENPHLSAYLVKAASLCVCITAKRNSNINCS